MRWKLKEPRAEGIKRKGRRSSGPLFQRNWVCKGMIWGNTCFPAAIPFEQASVAAHPSRLPSLWRVLTSFSLEANGEGREKLAEGIASRFLWGSNHWLGCWLFLWPCWPMAQQLVL